MKRGVAKLWSTLGPLDTLRHRGESRATGCQDREKLIRIQSPKLSTLADSSVQCSQLHHFLPTTTFTHTPRPSRRVFHQVGIASRIYSRELSRTSPDSRRSRPQPASRVEGDSLDSTFFIAVLRRNLCISSHRSSCVLLYCIAFGAHYLGKRKRKASKREHYTSFTSCTFLNSASARGDRILNTLASQHSFWSCLPAFRSGPVRISSVSSIAR